MSLRKLLLFAFLVPGPFCPAQKETPDARPADSPPPAVVPAVAQPSTAEQPAADTYVIGASDTLTVTVWKEPTLSGSLLVRPDGMISIPLVGDVQASGKTALQLADLVETKLKKFVQDPKVSVVITQIRSKIVYLLGEVQRRGPVEMTPDMTLLQAISSAGGLTDYANSKKIYILRNDAGTHQKIPVHYKEALNGDSAFDLILRPGDTIVVP